MFKTLRRYIGPECHEFSPTFLKIEKLINAVIPYIQINSAIFKLQFPGIKIFSTCPGGVLQSPSDLPDEQKTRVRIPSGYYKVVSEA
jgi:hypothetical protein